jgi:regulatory protein
VPRSLKARAVQWLTQREQSRVELRRKLLPYAKAEVQIALDTQAVETVETANDFAQNSFFSQDLHKRTPARRIANNSADASSLDHPMMLEQFCVSSLSTDYVANIATASERVDAVLDWLQANQYLCDTRFAESRANTRSQRFGNLRIRHELQQHQVALSPEVAQNLAESEVERACAVRERKFGYAPTTAVERAQQSRFLASRGFSSESIQNAVRRALLTALKSN